MSKGAQPDTLPYWMLLFSFIASFALTLLAIIEATFKMLRKATFDIVLTREVFFRILQSGESLYANVVMVSYDDGALIEDVSASLEKKDGPNKRFSMQVAQFGEKFRDSEGIYNFSFHSTSPLSFVPPSSPQRQVFVCQHESYAGDTYRCFQQFDKDLLEIKERYSKGVSDPNSELHLLADVQAAVEEAMSSIMDKVQIEPGRYSLEIKATYRQKRRMLSTNFRKTSVSAVEFTVADYAREYLRSSLRRYLEARAQQIILDANEVAAAPQYNPEEVKELQL